MHRANSETLVYQDRRRKALHLGREAPAGEDLAAGLAAQAAVPAEEDLPDVVEAAGALLRRAGALSAALRGSRR
jgi:hypothetical protein